MAGCRTPPILKPAKHSLDAVAALVFLDLASRPRSPSSQSTVGMLLSRARASMQSLSLPAVTNRLSGRPWPSQAGISLVFMPPLVRPIRRPRPPFFGHTGLGAVCDEISRVHCPAGDRGLPFAVPGNQLGQHSGEVTFLAPMLPPAVKRLVSSVFLGSIAPPRNIAVDEDNPA